MLCRELKNIRKLVLGSVIFSKTKSAGAELVDSWGGSRSGKVRVVRSMRPRDGIWPSCWCSWNVHQHGSHMHFSLKYSHVLPILIYVLNCIHAPKYCPIVYLFPVSKLRNIQAHSNISNISAIILIVVEVNFMFIAAHIHLSQNLCNYLTDKK